MIFTIEKYPCISGPMQLHVVQGSTTYVEQLLQTWLHSEITWRVQIHDAGWEVGEGGGKFTARDSNLVDLGHNNLGIGSFENSPRDSNVKPLRQTTDGGQILTQVEKSF